MQPRRCSRHLFHRGATRDLSVSKVVFASHLSASRACQPAKLFSTLSMARAVCMSMSHASHPSQPSSSQAAPDVRRDTEHQRGLHLLDATIISLKRPSPHTLRVGMHLGDVGNDPVWDGVNVAFRVYPDPQWPAISRVYTVRSFVPHTRCAEFDVVMHGGDSPMMRWAAQAAIGQQVRLTGPRGNIVLPRGEGRPVALFCDDSALPALYAILRRWPAGVQGVGWIASDDLHGIGELPTVPGLQLQRLPAHGTDLLLQQARQLQSPAQHLIWGAGERDEMRAIRKYFQTELGMDKADVSIAGYWKRGASNTDIDAERQSAYQKFSAAGGKLSDWDDLGIAL